MTKWIFAGIDGTGSTSWRLPNGSNSHVWRFCDRFDTSGGAKRYFDGPDSAGIDSEPIVNDVKTFIAESLARLIPRLQIRPDMSVSSALARTLGRSPLPDSSLAPVNWRWFDRSPEVIRSIQEAEIQFCLVGHSRGGVIAAEVARQIPIPVIFLGLFDAVDRAAMIEATVVHNVNVTRHARRHPSLESRTTFGNACLSSTGNYLHEFFRTSHGGVGGDATLYPTIGAVLDPTADTTCVVPLTANMSCHALSIPYTGGAVSTGICLPTIERRIVTGSVPAVCRSESARALEWMLGQARTARVPITTPQQ
jgi:hypothetical protein